MKINAQHVMSSLVEVAMADAKGKILQEKKGEHRGTIYFDSDVALMAWLCVICPSTKI
jgi:hypothetical protein